MAYDEKLRLEEEERQVKLAEVERMEVYKFCCCGTLKMVVWYFAEGRAVF